MRNAWPRLTAALLALLMGVAVPAHLALDHTHHDHHAHPAGCQAVEHACADEDHDAPGLHAVCDNHDARGCGQTQCHAHDVQEHLKSAANRSPAPFTAVPAPSFDATARIPAAPRPRVATWIHPPGEPPHCPGTPHRGPPHA